MNLGRQGTQFFANGIPSSNEPGSPYSEFGLRSVRWGFRTLPTLLSILKPPSARACTPEARWQPPRLAARHTFRLETEPRPAVRLSGSPPIWTSGSEAPFAVSAPPPHTPGLWLPTAGRAALGLILSLCLSQLPPPRISPRPGLRAELGRGRAVPQPSRLVVRVATWLCAPAADRAFPRTIRVVPGTQGPRETLRSAWLGSSPPPPGP